MASTPLNPICPRRHVEAAALIEFEQHRPGIMQQVKTRQRAVGGDQVEIGHAAPEQRVAVASRNERPTGHLPATRLRGSSIPRSSETVSPKALVRSVRTTKRGLHHRVAQYAGSDRVPLGVISIEETVPVMSA